MRNKLDLPENVKFIIDSLIDNGYKAYAVGGCVRDSLMGQNPHDWDICTSALPYEVEKVFYEYKVIETGIKHGTITLILKNIQYEITTFRSETAYSDNRHPDNVRFEKDIKYDLSRRDFTINAVAYNQYDGFIDLYCGIDDIYKKVIKSVGICDDRFLEDALRILRAIRFSSTLGFKIDEDTRKSIHKNKYLLKNIAIERIWTEFKKILLGKNSVCILREYFDVISVFIPEISKMVGFKQYNPHHCYDVWEHTLKALSYSEDDIYLKLAILFHDIGKPYTLTFDEKGTGHFYGHAELSAELTEKILTYLKIDSKTKKTVTILVKNHDRTIEPTEKSVKRTIRKLGCNELFEKLIKLKMCDVQAQSEEFIEVKLYELKKIIQIYESINSDDTSVISVKNLKINGNDIMKLGVKQGKKVGQILNILLDMVENNQINNEYSELIKKTSEIINN